MLSDFAEVSFARLGVFYLLVVKVPYLDNINSISDCWTDFPILGFYGSFHTQNNSVYIVMWCCECFSIFIFRYNISKEVHVWFSSNKLNMLFNPSLKFKGKFIVKCCWESYLYVVYCLHSLFHVLNYFIYFLWAKMEL